MAVTIVRPTIVDDDGSGTYGSIGDAAWVADLCNRIDAALAQVLPLAGGTLTGPLHLSIAGTGEVTLNLRNVTTGVLAQIAGTNAKGIVLYTNAGNNFALNGYASGGVHIGGPTPSDPGANNLSTTGTLKIGSRPAFAASDKYLVVDASGNVHVSALGPAS